MLHACRIPDSLANGMKPECRPPFATYCGRRTPFAWYWRNDFTVRKQGSSVAD